MNLKYFSKLAKASPVNQQVHGYNWVNIWGRLIKAIVCVHGLEKHLNEKITLATWIKQKKRILTISPQELISQIIYFWPWSNIEDSFP